LKNLSGNFGRKVCQEVAFCPEINYILNHLVHWVIYLIDGWDYVISGIGWNYVIWLWECVHRCVMWSSRLI